MRFEYIPHIFIKEATTKGYIEVKPNECWDWGFPDSRTRRGRYCGVKCNALQTGGRYGVICLHTERNERPREIRPFA